VILYAVEAEVNDVAEEVGPYERCINFLRFVYLPTLSERPKSHGMATACVANVARNSLFLQQSLQHLLQKLALGSRREQGS
jgi:hypothetical protein